MSELKPCPNCGADGALEYHCGVRYVECWSDECGHQGGMDWTDEGAISAWNSDPLREPATRPQPSAEPVADWLQECTDGRVSSHTITMLNAFRRWYDEYRINPALEAARREDQDCIAALEADKARLMGLVKGVEEALDAVHYYIDASDEELLEDGLTREGALYRARVMREALAKIKETPDA